MVVFLNVLFITMFFGSMIIVGKILLDSNFDKLFKQGRVGSIRVAYAVVMIVVSFLIAWCFKELVAAFYYLFV